MATVVQGNAVFGTTGTSRNTSFASTPTSGNLLVLHYGARDANNTQLPSFTMPSGWTKAVEVVDMEFHTTGIAWRVSDGTESGPVTVTADISCNSWWVGLVEYNQSGVTDWALDKTAQNGSGATNVASIASGSTGTLGAAVGVAAIAGTSRTGNEDLSTDTGTSLASTHASLEVDAGSANFIAAWLSLASTSALDATITEGNGASRMGAAIATFIEAGGAGVAVQAAPVGVGVDAQASSPVLAGHAVQASPALATVGAQAVTPLVASGFDPANLQATVDGSDVTLSWDASF